MIKGVSKTIQNEAKEGKGGFFCMSLGTLGASLLGNILISKRVTRSKITGQGVMTASEETLEQTKIFNAASSFNKFWNTKVLWKRIQI